MIAEIAVTIEIATIAALVVSIKVITTRIFFVLFLRDQNSQQFNEDLLGVNASAFSFVLCFKAINYAGASNYVVSAN